MKAQGLPLNTIVLGALAVLVLVILAAVFIPGVGDFLRTLIGFGPDAYQSCNSYCTSLSNVYSDATTANGAITNSEFCAATDWDGDGTATENCYTGNYKTNCVVTLLGGGGTSNTIDCASADYFT